MKLIKIENGSPVGNPINENELRKLYPNISFPRKIIQENITQIDYYILYEGERPITTIFERIIQGPHQLIDGKWYTSWVVESFTEEEIKYATNIKKQDIRRQRDIMLQETDWVVIKSKELNEEVPLYWITYRQELRDITNQLGFPYDVIWPEKPL